MTTHTPIVKMPQATYDALVAERDALRSALQKLTDEVGMNYLDLTEGEKLADSYDRARALLGGAK